MTNVSLARLFAFCALLCITKDSCGEGSNELETKVNILLRSEEDDPKCFLKGTVEMFCFWQERAEDNGTIDQYTFRYTYENDNTTVCPLKVLSIGGRRKIYYCEIFRVIFYVSMGIEVLYDGQLIHNRTLLADEIFLLDPPGNLTLKRTAKPGQLKVKWLPSDFIDDGLLYEISYAITGSQMGKREEVCKTDLLLQDLQPGVSYSVRARVRPESSGFSGWWSAWTDPVTMEMPDVMDPLILVMSLIISFILLLLSLTVLLTHRRFLLKKLWPLIPSPESKFPDLFTVYKGDFQEWMKHSPDGMRWIQTYYYTEEPVSPLEVLSEVNIRPPLPSCISSHRDIQALEADGPMQLEEGKQEVDRGSPHRWSELQHEAWILEHLRNLHHHPPPYSQSSLLESHDAYVSLNHSTQKPGEEEETQEREGDGLEDILEEIVPLQTLFVGTRTSSSASHSDLGSLQQSSASGQLSTQSSFEYPNQTWPPNGPSYTYMAVADSGVSTDYSPMSSSQYADSNRKHKPRVIYANEYKNELPLIDKRMQAVDSDCSPLGICSSKIPNTTFQGRVRRVDFH